MAPWMWLAAGTALLAIELLLIDAQFYLVFMGLAAIIVGLVALVGVELPVWGEWSTFGLLSLVFLFGFRRRRHFGFGGQHQCGHELGLCQPVRHLHPAHEITTSCGHCRKN